MNFYCNTSNDSSSFTSGSSMPSPPSQHQQLIELRNAIALNNMASVMIERDCFRQAHETLREALSILKEVSPTMRQKCRDRRSSNNSTSSSASLLQTACRRQSQPEPESLSSHASPAVTIVSLSDDTSLKRLLLNARRATANQGQQELQFIRIDNECEFHTGDSIELTTAIIMYNFASSHVLLAADKNCRRRTHLQAAMQLLRVSKGMLAPQFRSCMDKVRASQALLVAMLVVEMQMLVLRTSGRFDATTRDLLKSYGMALARLQQVAQDVESTRVATADALALPAAAA